MLRFALIALVTVLGTSSASAQIVNVQSILATEAEEGLSGSVTGTVDWRTGNVDLMVLSLAPVARYRSGKHLLIGYGKGELGRNNGTRILARTFEHVRYRYQFSDRWLGEVFGQHVFDEFRRLKLRSLTGIGPNVTMVKGKKLRIASGLSYMLEYEVLQDGDEPDAGDKTLFHRMSGYLTGSYKVDKTIQLVQTAYAQPRLDDFGDTRILCESQMVVQVTSHVAVKTTFSAAYDSRPPAAIEKLDTGLKASFTYSF